MEHEAVTGQSQQLEQRLCKECMYRSIRERGGSVWV
jgi:hypothetical protein